MDRARLDVGREGIEGEGRKKERNERLWVGLLGEKEDSRMGGFIYCVSSLGGVNGSEPRLAH